MLLSLLLAGHGSIALHTVLIPHGVCSEHGETIHADSAAEPRTARSATAVGSASVAPAEAGASHGHDHCWLVTRDQTRTFAPKRVTSVVPPTMSSESEPAWRAAAPMKRQLILLFSPKQSPPASA
jgi:hypothetical protein